MINKLIKIQQELKVPKNQFNSFGKYKYRSCEDIVEAVKKLNVEHGLLLTLSDEIVCVGTRVYVKATALLTDGKTEIQVFAYAREEETKKGMDGSQITGTASSYARKYALNGLYCIDDTKDSDFLKGKDEEPLDERTQNQVKHDLDVKVKVISKSTSTDESMILKKLIERANIKKPIHEFTIDDFIECEKQAILSIKKIEESK